MKVGWAASLSIALLLCVGCSSAASQAHDVGMMGAQALARVHGGGTLRRIGFFSPALNRRDYYLIHLPRGYAAAARNGTRFPVLYLLHGDGTGKRHLAIHMYESGRVGPTAGRLLAAGRIQRFLIVMPEANDGTLVDDMEWANTSQGSYQSEIADLVRSVDGRWATIPQRTERAIAGLSMGGYGAVNAALHQPQLFATIESWSGYFMQTPTAVFAGASPAALRANSPTAYVDSLRATLRSHPMRFLLYGSVTDPLTSQQAPFASKLRALGITVQTATFSGPHNFALWSKHMSLALRFASRGLRPMG